MDFSGLLTETINPATKNIDKEDSLGIAKMINEEDKKVAFCVEKALPEIAAAIDSCAAVLNNGGRMFYGGAGTSGRLGVLDASECPPTYGVPCSKVIGLIAGGRDAAFSSVEYAEDEEDSIVLQMKAENFTANDVFIGLSASGSANCVKGALRYARSLGAATISVQCNSNSPMIELSDVAVVVTVGPEVINGSTRMKAGTAQKMVINMISTGAMVKFGRTRGNYMAFMVPSNIKLRERAVRMITEKTGCDRDTAEKSLAANNNVIAYAIDEIEGKR